MNDIIRWLHSEEGEEWSRTHHRGIDEGGQPVRHSTGVFASIKHDHECHHNGRKYVGCAPNNGYTWLDKQIKEEINRYGMNGLADAA